MQNWTDIVSALEDRNYTWRTIRGLAKQLDAPQREIENLLARNADEIIKSAVPAESGEALYTTRRHYRRMVSPLDKLASSITQSVTARSSTHSADKE